MRYGNGSSLLERVTGLFALRRAADAPAPRTAVPQPPVSIAGARFSLVGLAELREQLGDRWPALSARVHELAQTVIQRHLGRGDVFDAHGEDGYVILFTQLTELQAEFKCRVIAKEIASKLLGADWVGKASDGVVFELPESALKAPSFPRALDAAIARGRTIVEAEPAAPRGPRMPAAEEGAAAATRQDKALAELLKPIERERRSVAYWPVWDFGAGALLRFRLKSPPLPPGAALSDAAKADVAALTQVLFDVSQLLQTGRRLPVICPVRLETMLRDGWRTQIARMLRGAPPVLRKLVTLEVVVELDDGDWLGPLERAWTTMPDLPVVSMPLQASLLPARTSSVVKRLNLALAEGFAANKRGIDVLGAFVQKAERAGMTCGITGLRTRPAALAATAAGFQQLSGPAIHAEVASLGQAVHFDLKSLYRDLLPQAV
jgi:hypothetical protein